MKVIRAIAIFFIIGLFITLGIMPGLSHKDTETLISNNQIVSVEKTQHKSNLTEAQNLVLEGKEFYQTEKYQEAINALEQAAKIFTESGASQSEAITRSNLSLAYQQLGNWQAAQGAIAKSLTLLEFNYNLELPETWEIPDFSSEKLQIIARTINIYGRLNYVRGNPKRALDSWQLTSQIYQKLNDKQGILKTQINRIQALQALGLHQEAKKESKIVEENLDYLPNDLKFKGLISLGNVFRTTGDLATSEQFLIEGIALAESNNSQNYLAIANSSLADTWHSWGNLERERLLPIRYEYFPWRCEMNESLSLSGDTVNLYKKAENKYRQVLNSEKNNKSSTTAIKGRLNLLKLLITSERWLEAEKLANNIQLSQLPNSRTKVYSQINFAKSLACLKQHNYSKDTSWKEIGDSIETAIQEATRLEDTRAKSYALGNLGGLYEYFALQQADRSRQWRQQAKQLTQQALYLAQPREMPDIAYQWQWQLGRLLEAEKNTAESIRYYQSAVQTLESVRGDLLTIDSEVQFSFRDNIEPVYRQLVQLLLQQPSPENLVQTRRVVQNLQLAELENFLRCNLNNTQELDKIANRPSAKEAIIYPIILDGQIDVILKLPNDEELKYHTTKISREIIDKTIQQLQSNLAKPHTRKQVQTDASQVYEWLISPFITDLERSKVDTLVFFLDTSLRNIPMSVLYDGNNYLIEKYAVAVTSGLELLEPRTLQRDRLNGMLAGLTESRQNYPPLPEIDRQFEQISEEIPSQVLLDEQFTVSNFQERLQSLPFPVVHIATHGQFSSRPEETFILAWDNFIDLDRLSNLLKNSEASKSQPIELLVLAACETAQGDKRATLGLAGIAINAGARSTLATLWKISADRSPGDLLSQFYQELVDNPNLAKAGALRRAQLKFLQDDSRARPYYWASYVLLGNWL